MSRRRDLHLDLSAPTARRSFPGRGMNGAGFVFVAAFALAAFTAPGLRSQENALSFNGLEQFVEIQSGTATEVIVDNKDTKFADSGFTRTGNWVDAAVSDHFRLGSLNSDEDATATWTPVLPSAGYYRVLVRWGNTISSTETDPRATAAEYLVNHADGVTSFVRDQNADADQWNLLGRFRFVGDGEEWVRLVSSQFNDGPVNADAVRFVKEPFDLSEAITLEAWVNVTAFDKKWQAIVTKGEAWGLVRHDGTGSISFHTETGVSSHDVVSPAPLNPGQWYHVAGVYDGQTKKLFIDGQEVASEPYQVALVANDFPVTIGANAEAVNRGFNGVVDNVRVWDLPRLQTELDANQQRRMRGSEVGLLAAWRFNETSGLLAPDIGLNELDGDLRNMTGTEWVAGIVLDPPLPGEQSLQFDGDGQYVELGDEATFDYTDMMTVEGWVYVDQFGKDQALITKGDTAWHLWLTLSGAVVFSTPGLINISDGTEATDLFSVTELFPGRWYHIAATWDGATKRIYIDGAEDSRHQGVTGAIDTNQESVRFASLNGHPDMDLQGRLDEIRIWRTPLTPVRIAANYNRRLTESEPRLDGDWHFNEGSGPDATDSGLILPLISGTLIGMGDINRVVGVDLLDALPPQYALFFDGIDDYIEIPHDPLLNLQSFTLEVWIRPQGTGFRTILMKGQGDVGYGLALNRDNRLLFWVNGNIATGLLSERRVVNDLWQHVAITVDQVNDTTIFYIDGKPAGTFDIGSISAIKNNNDPLVFGKQGSAINANYYMGLMDEMRIWNTVRTNAQILGLSETELPANAEGLLGYWDFDDGIGSVLAEFTGQLADGTLRNMTDENWVFGREAEALPLAGGVRLAPNPIARGLWVGSVHVTRVNEVQTSTPGNSGRITPTYDAADIRILLHANKDGEVSLLKDVILMARVDGVADNVVNEEDLGADPDTKVVLVTDETLIPNFKGLINRRGKLVGQRIGSVVFDFAGNELEMIGGVGEGFAALGRIELARTHPTNPFRHKFHPDHRNFDPRDDPNHPDYNPEKPVTGVAVTRAIMVQFPPLPIGANSLSGGYGVDRIEGTYTETILGLHKIPLKVEGTISLNRISLVDTLNQ